MFARGFIFTLQERLRDFMGPELPTEQKGHFAGWQVSRPVSRPTGGATQGRDSFGDEDQGMRETPLIPCANPLNSLIFIRNEGGRIADEDQGFSIRPPSFPAQISHRRVNWFAIVSKRQAPRRRKKVRTVLQLSRGMLFTVPSSTTPSTNPGLIPWTSCTC